MKKIEFSYKGKTVSIEQGDDKGVISIDNQYKFECFFHDHQLPMWTCAGPYLMSADTKSLAKKLVDNFDILTAPTTAPISGMQKIHPDGHGKKSK